MVHHARSPTDFCEPGLFWDHFELMGTLSSLCITCAAAWVLYKRQRLHPLSVTAAVMLGAVGVSSALYHADVSSEMFASMDENSMTLIVMLGLQAIVWKEMYAHERASCEPRVKWLGVALQTSIVLLALLTLHLRVGRPTLHYIIFGVLFAALILFVEWRYVNEGRGRIAGVAVTGLLSWLASQWGCPEDERLKHLVGGVGHSVWHVAVACTGYLLIVTIDSEFVSEASGRLCRPAPAAPCIALRCSRLQDPTIDTQ